MKKAKLISTGETVEVCVDMDYNGNITWLDTSSKTEYYPSELEFLPEESKEVTIEGWVARSGSGPTDLALRVYSVKPIRITHRKAWNGHGEVSYLIDYRLFPSITWESEPKRVKMAITPIEE